MHRTRCGPWGVLAALTLWMVCTAPASARVYTFTKVADSAKDGFNPFSFEALTSPSPLGSAVFEKSRFLR